MAKIKFILIGLLSLLFLVNTCSAMVDFTIPEGTKYAHPGDNISYDLDVSLEQPIDDSVSYPITEEFSVDPIRQDWGYSFSQDKVTLDPSNLSASSILYVKVPDNALPGEYSDTVYATGTDSSGNQYANPIEVTFSVINTNVSVPEFPSVAVPVVAVLGLVAIIGRRKE